MAKKQFYVYYPTSDTNPATGGGTVFGDTDMGTQEYVGDPNQVDWSNLRQISSPLDLQNPGMSVVNRPEYSTALRSLYDSLNKPSLDLSNQALDQSATDINRQYDSMAELLDKESANAKNSFLETQNALGLLPSGGTNAGLTGILERYQKSKTETMQDKISRLATIAIQRAGLAADYTKNALSFADTYKQNAIGRTQNTWNARYSIASELPVGQTLETPYGTIEGIKPKTANTDIITANGRQLLIDRSTGDVLRDLGSAYKGDSGGSGGSAASKKQSLYDDLQADIEENLADWTAKGKPAWWTENTLIPALESYYIPKGLTSANIRKLVYNTRKQSNYGGE